MGFVRINQGKALTLPYRLIIVAILLATLLWLFDNLQRSLIIPTSILVSSIAPFVWFATKILEIDVNTSQMFKGVWSMGFKKGKRITFESITIKMETRKTPKRLYRLPNNQKVITDKEFVAYIKTEKNDQFYLFSHPDKNRIKEKVSIIEKKLGFLND